MNTLADQRRHGRDVVGWTPEEKNLIATAAARAPLIHNTRPWVLEFHDPERRVSLYDDTTAVPDIPTLTDRLRGELLVVVETSDDGPLDHVRVGLAAAEIWLAATAAGLAASLLTQLFHLPEIRAGLVESLSLNGFPQLLLRFGHPIDQLEER